MVTVSAAFLAYAAGSLSSLVLSLGGRGAGISRKIAASIATAAGSSIRSGNPCSTRERARLPRRLGGWPPAPPCSWRDAVWVLAHGGMLCGDVTFRARPIVRPVACVRAFTCRRAREGRDGTIGGTITHGDGSSVVRARQCPRLTWTARPAPACSRRCRYSFVRFIPVMRMSSPISVPSSGAMQSASQSASSAVADLPAASGESLSSAELPS